MDAESEGEDEPPRIKNASGIVSRLPSKIASAIFGKRGELGVVRQGLLSKRYPNRAEEIVLDEDELDLVDEAFAKPLQKILKWLGLSSDEMAMIVVGITVLAPRAFIAIEEEQKKGAETASIHEAVHGAASR